MKECIKKIYRFEELKVKEIKNFSFENIVKVEMPIKEHISPAVAE